MRTSDFSYRLVCLIHSDHEDTLAATLAAFREHAMPAPSDGFLLCDGCGVPEVDWPWRVGCTDEQVGFCAATAVAWREAAAEPGPEYVFYLEHDFLLTRDVNLPDLAAVLNGYAWVAQMALMRDAVNEHEKKAGGLFESRPGQYERHRFFYHHLRDDLPEGYTSGWNPRLEPGDSVIVGPNETDTYEWLIWHQHASYLTTNPSLMRRQFMAEHLWPAYESECEGRFGLDLVATGFSFGVWGDGSPWCEHIGERSGFGY